MLSVRKKERFALRMQKKIVLIYSDSLDYSSGHGVLISSNGYILTASHLFRFDSHEHSIGSNILVKCNDGKTVQRFHAKITAIGRKSDLTLLQIVKAVDRRIKKQKFKCASIAEEVQVGQELHMIMSTDDHNFSYTSGLVCFENRECDDIKDRDHIFFISKKTYFVQGHGLHGIPGCSGAPVFDSRGQIIGIYSTGYRRMDLLVHLTLVNKMCEPFIQQVETSQSGQKKKKKGKRKCEDIEESEPKQKRIKKRKRGDDDESVHGIKTSEAREKKNK